MFTLPTQTATKKVRVTVEIEFSERGLLDYKDAVMINYDDDLPKLKDVREYLAHYAMEGIESHFVSIDADPLSGSTINAL
jgi:hypothetical protein